MEKICTNSEGEVLNMWKDVRSDISGFSFYEWQRVDGSPILKARFLYKTEKLTHKFIDVPCTNFSYQVLMNDGFKVLHAIKFPNYGAVRETIEKIIQGESDWSKYIARELEESDDYWIHKDIDPQRKREEIRNRIAKIEENNQTLLHPSPIVIGVCQRTIPKGTPNISDPHRDIEPEERELIKPTLLALLEALPDLQPPYMPKEKYVQILQERF